MKFTSGIIAFVASVYVASVLLWPLQTVHARLTALPVIETTKASLAWPDQGYAAIGSSADGVLAQSSPTEIPVPIASITKIITALTVLEAKPLGAGETGPTITLTAADAARYGEYLAQNGSVASAPAGLQVTQRQMLEAMLIVSANNYADSLALWAYGTPEAYFAAANTLLNKYKLTNTSVADMTGFSPDSKSTPSDLIRLGELALKQPVIAEIVSQKTVTIPGVGTLQNTNILLGTEGIQGMKTGTTDEAGSCLLFSATHQVGTETITIIGVVLGAPNHATLFNQVKTLLLSVKPNFQEVTLLKSNQQVGEYRTAWGAQSKAIVKNSATQVIWGDEKIIQATSLQSLHPGDTKAGSVTSKIAGKTLTTSVTLDEELVGPSWHWRLTHPHEIF